MLQTATGGKHLFRGESVSFGLWLACFGYGATDKRAVGLLQMVELGQCQSGGKSHRIACVNARKEWVYGVIEIRLAQSAGGQSTYRLIGISAFAPPRLAENTQLIVPREERRGECAADSRRKGMESTVFPD